MKTVIIIILSVCLIASCKIGKSDSDKAREESITEIKVEKQVMAEVLGARDQELLANRYVRGNVSLDIANLPEQLDDGCDLANIIRKMILSYLLEQDHTVLNGKEFIKLIEDNKNHDCSFPRNDVELKMLYVFTQKLLSESAEDQHAIELIFGLKENFANVVEFSEHLQFVIPQVALINTSGFVKTLSICDIDEKERIIDLLQFFDNKTAIEAFRLNLSKLTTHQDIVESISKFLINEFGV